MVVWRKLSGERIEKPLNEQLELCIKNELHNKLKVCIGSDSQVKGGIVEFATVIVFLRQGKGGFAFSSKYRTQNKYSIKERMLKEVSDSIKVAYDLCPIFDKYNLELEVHADINTDPHFKSNVALKEAMGYILGMGYKFKAKPEAFASSYCANKIVK